MTMNTATHWQRRIRWPRPINNSEQRDETSSYLRHGRRARTTPQWRSENSVYEASKRVFALHVVGRIEFVLFRNKNNKKKTNAHAIVTERLCRRHIQGQYATCPVIVLVTSHMFVSGTFWKKNIWQHCESPCLQPWLLVATQSCQIIWQNKI